MKGGGYVRQPMQVFSIRIAPEILRKIRELAWKEKMTAGAIVRENLDRLLKSKGVYESKTSKSSHSDDGISPGSV